MKDSTNENIKFKLNSKARISKPKGMNDQFSVKFREHRKLKQQNSKWFRLSLIVTSLCLVLAIVFNNTQTPRDNGSVKDYLAFFERNISSDDHILENIDEFASVSYNEIDYNYGDL